MKSVGIRVIGQVQGVSYRVYAQAAAAKLGLTGFVQNEPDGSVYMEAHGSNVEEFIDWCRMGSPAAEVDAVRVAPVSPANWPDFSIRD